MVDDLIELQLHLAYDLLLQELLITRADAGVVHVVVEDQLLLLASEGIGEHFDFVGDDDDLFKVDVPDRNVLHEVDLAVFVPDPEVTDPVEFLVAVGLQVGIRWADRKEVQFLLLGCVASVVVAIEACICIIGRRFTFLLGLKDELCDFSEGRLEILP